MNKIMMFLPLIVLAAAFIVVFMVLRARKPDNTAYQSAVGIALVAAFLLFWVNGAVGIIGAARDDANMMYYGVLAVGFIGAIIARFQPHGMARTLFATALAQVLVAAIALIAGLGSTGPIWPWDILTLTGFFVALFVGSAWLFRNAAGKKSPAGGEPGG
jgi:NADH:ubiquinone oxidoreductase subunit 2 (subunit N)